MALRTISTVFAVVAVGAAVGMIGQSLVAQAGAPTTSDKTIYGKANPAFSHSMDENGGGPTSVFAVTVHAPAAGTAAVDVNSQIWADFAANGGATQLDATMQIGRCSAPNSLSTSPPAACANVSTYWFVKPGNTSGIDITEPYSIQSLLTFGSAGTRTIYLTAQASGARAGMYNNAHVQVAFTPKSPISTTATLTVSATALGVDP
jgi:hypothetical protein